MSDQSQGPGWWQASDGKWYAPEQHPDFDADATSVSLCRDNDIDMIVFNLSEEGNIARVVAGEKIGTTVSRDV